MSKRPLQIGAVRYLNSKPLIEGLNELIGDAELRLECPSRLADMLAKRELDVALVPSIEYFRHEDYVVVSDACVAARGPVLSVKLYCRVPPSEMSTLALDEGSRTSATLVRIMLWEQFGVEPEVVSFPLGADVASTTTDGVLLIGDRAMHPPGDQFVEVWDLGEKWNAWTGLPFVFAMWVGHADVDLEDLEEHFCRARDLGESRLTAIAEREAGPLGISTEMAYGYLSENLHYRLGSREKNGLKMFYQLATERDLAPGGIEIVYRDCLSPR